MSEAEAVKTLIWGHRGAAEQAPENSMESFRLAMEMGADGIELDVHLTRDQQIVVAHDETIDRCSNGSGRILDMTLEELSRYDFSCGKAGFSGVRIPSLAEVLELIKGSDLTVNIEIKSGVIAYEGLEEMTMELVDQMGLADRIIYSSFNHFSLTTITAVNPGAVTGILYSEALIDPHLYAEHVGASAIHPHYPTVLRPGIIEACREHEIRVHPWTADDPEAIRRLLEAGVDAIITNRPDEALELRSAMQG